MLEDVEYLGKTTNGILNGVKWQNTKITNYVNLSTI